MAKRGPKGPSKYTVEYVNRLADELLEYAETNPLPFFNKFALDRRIPPQSFSDDKAFFNNPKFSESLKIAKGWLEYKIVVAGLAKKVDNAMAIFALKNVAGWRDKQPDEENKNNNIIINIVNARIETKKDTGRHSDVLIS